MKYIYASKGMSAIVDDDDYALLKGFSWYAHSSGGGKGKTPEYRPARRTGKEDGRKVIFLVHHIMPRVPGMVIDHINGDPWDNRRSNLRVCTHAENIRNARQRNGRHLPKGVYLINGRYLARITCYGVSHSLGWFADPIEAARAYDSAALTLHGEFACPNFNNAVARPLDQIHWERKGTSIGSERRVVALRRVENGEKASRVAADIGVSPSTVCHWAKAEGIALCRGRARKAA